MDPFMTGQMMIAGAQNPGIGPALDSMGIPPPMGGQQPGIGDWITQTNPAQPGGQPGQMTPQQLMQLAQMGGVKAPAPITPIMNGGVTGGVKPPQVNENVAKQGDPAIQALMAALLSGRGQAPAVPSLGALIHGRGQ